MKILKLKNYLRISILLFITSFFIACSDNEPLEIESSEKQQIKREFSLANFNDSFIKENLIGNWNDFKTNQKDSTTYEFNTSFKTKRSLENDNQLFGTKYKILAIKGTLKNWSFELIKFLSNDDEPLDNISYFHPYTYPILLSHYHELYVVQSTHCSINLFLTAVAHFLCIHKQTNKHIKFVQGYRKNT